MKHSTLYIIISLLLASRPMLNGYQARCHRGGRRSYRTLRARLGGLRRRMAELGWKPDKRLPIGLHWIRTWTTSPIVMVSKSHIKSGDVLGSLSPAIGVIKSFTVRAISLAAAQSGITSSSDIRGRTRRERMQPLRAW